MHKKVLTQLHRISKTSILLFLIILLLVTARLWGEVYQPEILINEDNWLDGIDYDLLNFIEFPININLATISELRRIPGLTEEEIARILHIRQQSNIYNARSLQKAGISPEKIDYILPYISFKIIAPVSFFQSQRYYYQSYDTGILTRFYQKTELQRENTTIGFVSLSDFGSRELTRHNSYYFSQQTDGTIEQIVLGKYRLSLGQGITYAPQSGFSKSSAATTYPVKNHSLLRPHSNPYKNWSLEGLAVRINTGPLEFIPFYSETLIDASLTEEKISTIYPYGTPVNDRRDNVLETITGLAMRYQNMGDSYGLYYSQNSFDKGFVDSSYPQSYDCYGLYLNFRRDEFDLIGEWASLNNKQGLIAGVRWGRAKIQQLLLYRSYEKDLLHWHGNPFSSQSNFANEEGIYYGIRLRMNPIWTFNAFFDIWKHPDTRYFEKMPTTRTEQYLQLVFNKPGDTVRVKLHHKNYDKYRVLNDIPKIRIEHKTVTAIDWNHHLSHVLSKKTAIEYVSHYIPEIRQFKKGILLSENISWNYRKTRFIYQINIFRTVISHYIYEHSLEGMWENRPLTGDDLYNYLIIRAEITSDLKLQSKIAHFFSGKRQSIVIQIICRL